MSKMVDKLVKRIRYCQKGNFKDEMNILKTVYGEIELIRARNIHKFSDEDVVKIFKKFRDGVKETILILGKTSKPIPQGMIDEISIYDKWIPPTASVDDIVSYLEINFADQIIGLKSDGQATGIAITFLKKSFEFVDGRDVAQAVKIIRTKNRG